MRFDEISKTIQLTVTNQSTRITTFVMTMLLAFAGFEHGLFASLQGNKPTGGFFIMAIGDEHLWWKYGGEGAVTVIHNFLFSGITAMSVSFAIVFWAWRFVHRKNGVLVLLLLFILLTSVGGGIGFTPFYLITCAYATRISKPLNWWRRVLSSGVRKRLAPIWPYSLAVAVLSWLLALEIAVFGYVPGQDDPEILINICWSFLLLTFIMANLSYISGFANDIGRQGNV